MKTFSTAKTLSAILVLLNLLGLGHSGAQAQNSCEPAATPISAATNNLHPVDEKLAVFVSRAAEDATLQALFTKHQLMLQCTVADRGLIACIGFDGRNVTGRLGQPAQPAGLVFVSDAKTLDRVLRGGDVPEEMQVTVNLDLMRKLSLKRDLKKLRAALARVYLSVPENQPAVAGVLVTKAGGL